MKQNITYNQISELSSGNVRRINMWVTEKKSISQADYKKYINATKKEVEEFVGWAAHFSAYPPAGYGMANPRVEMINDDYFAVWEHSNDCD